MGPNFKPPAAPPGARVRAREASCPRHRLGTRCAGGEAQRFVDGLDIPGQWWTLFQSAELNALIERALAHNPTLEAAQAALRQANETVAAQRGALYPSVSGQYEAERAKASAAQFGLPTSASVIYTP